MHGGPTRASADRSYAEPESFGSLVQCALHHHYTMDVYTFLALFHTLLVIYLTWRIFTWFHRDDHWWSSPNALNNRDLLDRPPEIDLITFDQATPIHQDNTTQTDFLPIFQTKGTQTFIGEQYFFDPDVVDAATSTLNYCQADNWTQIDDTLQLYTNRQTQTLIGQGYFEDRHRVPCFGAAPYQAAQPGPVQRASSPTIEDLSQDYRLPPPLPTFGRGLRRYLTHIDENIQTDSTPFLNKTTQTGRGRGRGLFNGTLARSSQTDLPFPSITPFHIWSRDNEGHLYATPDVTPFTQAEIDEKYLHKKDYVPVGLHNIEYRCAFNPTNDGQFDDYDLTVALEGATSDPESNTNSPVYTWNRYKGKVSRWRIDDYIRRTHNFVQFRTHRLYDLLRQILLQQNIASVADVDELIWDYVSGNRSLPSFD